MFEFSRNGQSGAVLPLIMILLALMTAATLAVSRAAIVNTRLVSSVHSSSNAFWLAERVMHAALRSVRDNPAALPVAGHIDLAPMQNTAGSARTRIRVLGTQAGCAVLDPLPSERTDYEIQVTTNSARGALRHHRQGIFICRELCAPPCIGIETPAQTTYWYQTRPDKP